MSADPRMQPVTLQPDGSFMDCGTPVSLARIGVQRMGEDVRLRGPAEQFGEDLPTGRVRLIGVHLRGRRLDGYYMIGASRSLQGMVSLWLLPAG
jgi:hypothetical protein